MRDVTKSRDLFVVDAEMLFDGGDALEAMVYFADSIGYVSEASAQSQKIIVRVAYFLKHLGRDVGFAAVVRGLIHRVREETLGEGFEVQVLFNTDDAGECVVDLFPVAGGVVDLFFQMV